MHSCGRVAWIATTTAGSEVRRRLGFKDVLQDLQGPGGLGRGRQPNGVARAAPFMSGGRGPASERARVSRSSATDGFRHTPMT